MTSHLSLPAPVGEVFAVRPAPARYRSGLIAAVCTAAPILLGQATGHPALGLIASSGALAALYSGSGTSARAEAAEVGAAALGLTASFALGTALAGHPWANVAGNALWAALAAAVCALLHARPPGIVMFVLLGTVGGGLPPGEAGQRIAAVAAVAFTAAALCCLSALPHHAALPKPEPQARSLTQLPYAIRGLARSPIPWMSARTGLGVAIAGSAALACGLQRPYWAMAAAGAVMARGSFAGGTRTLALLRGTGTAAGCLLAGAIAWLRPEGLAVAVVLAALTFITELVVVHNYAAAMVFVTPLSTVLVAAASHDGAVFSLAGDRLLETVLGCLAAVLAGQLATRRWAVRQRRRALAGVLYASADLMEEPGRAQHVTALHHAHSQMLLVGDRTAGERRSVRSAVAGLNEVGAAVRDLAERHLQPHGAAHGDARRTAAEARRLARLLDPGSGSRSAAPAPPAALADLRNTIERWAASTDRPTTCERSTP